MYNAYERHAQSAAEAEPILIDDARKIVNT
jgi:hypothetical protein